MKRRRRHGRMPEPGPPAVVMSGHHLAQLNIGRLRHPRHAAQMHGYRDALGPLTAIATAWPGFVWMHDDGIIELAGRTFGAGMAANLSVWRDIESLQGFMTCPEHAAVMARRGVWFVPQDQATFVLWWIPAGRRPSLADGHERLMLLRRQGPTCRAFDLDDWFPPPSRAGR